MSKIYVMAQSSATFGQTAAGYHVAVSEKRVADKISLDARDYPTTEAANEAAAAFIQKWGARVMIRIEGGDYPYTMSVPVEPSLKGLQAVQELIAAREDAGRPSMPYIETRTPGHTRFALRPEPAEPAKVHWDRENLSYQKTLLS